MLSVLSVFALDITAETRMPCWIAGFNYFSRLKLAVATPLVIIVVCIGVIILIVNLVKRLIYWLWVLGQAG